jgi:hypothetical protein
VPQVPVLHSLQCDGWYNMPNIILRDLSEKNPIRRDLALLSGFEGTYAAERRWADRLRALGVVHNEVYIDREMYHYQNSSTDHFMLPREPLDAPRPRPEFASVTWL